MVMLVDQVGHPAGQLLLRANPVLAVDRGDQLDLRVLLPDGVVELGKAAIVCLVLLKAILVANLDIAQR